MEEAVSLGSPVLLMVESTLEEVVGSTSRLYQRTDRSRVWSRAAVPILMGPEMIRESWMMQGFLRTRNLVGLQCPCPVSGIVILNPISLHWLKIGESSWAWTWASLLLSGGVG